MFRGIPMTIAVIPFSTTIFCSLDRNPESLGIVSTGCASMPSSSELAIPMRLAPRSIPRRRILLKFFGQRSDQVFYPFNFVTMTYQDRVLSLDNNQVVHANQRQMKLLIRENNVIVRSFHGRRCVSSVAVRQLLQILGNGRPTA